MSRGIAGMMMGGVLALGVAGVAGAAPVLSLHTSNQAIDGPSFAWEVEGTNITTFETWSGIGDGVLQFENLDHGVNYTLRRNITLPAGIGWLEFTNELLDPVGPAFDPGNDAMDSEFPPFVPEGFSASNNHDGLSFAQGGGVPRLSDVFDTVVPDELAGRDFLHFFNELGVLPQAQGTPPVEPEPATGTFFVEFGLRDFWGVGQGLRLEGSNNPFLLYGIATVVPEPGALACLGLGLIALAFVRRPASVGRR